MLTRTDNRDGKKAWTHFGHPTLLSCFETKNLPSQLLGRFDVFMARPPGLEPGTPGLGNLLVAIRQGRVIIRKTLHRAGRNEFSCSPPIPKNTRYFPRFWKENGKKMERIWMSLLCLFCIDFWLLIDRFLCLVKEMLHLDFNRVSCERVAVATDSPQFFSPRTVPWKIYLEIE